MSEQKPQMRYNEEELSLIKGVFAENEEALRTLRKVFLQADLNDSEEKILKGISGNEPLLKVLRKTYAPELDVNCPLGQVIDLWMTVDANGKTPEEVAIALKVRKELKELLEDGLNRIENPSEVSSPIADYVPDFKASAEEQYIKFSARNALISHTETQLFQLKNLAGWKKETPEETKERLMQDSSK